MLAEKTQNIKTEVISATLLWLEGCLYSSVKSNKKRSKIQRWMEALSCQNLGVLPSSRIFFPMTPPQTCQTSRSGTPLSCFLSLICATTVRRSPPQVMVAEKCSLAANVVKDFNTWSLWKGTKPQRQPVRKKWRQHFGIRSSFVELSRVTVKVWKSWKRISIMVVTPVLFVEFLFRPATNSPFMRRSISRGFYNFSWIRMVMLINRGECEIYWKAFWPFDCNAMILNAHSLQYKW